MDALFSHPLFMPLILSAIIILGFPLVAGYIVLVERKVLADMQVRLGPMRVGPNGLLQPIADALKLLIKEDIVPTHSDKAIFWIAPVISCVCAFSGFTVIPFNTWIRIADVNVGLLVISATSSVGILGIILGGWASNSHYSLLGALRSAAQLVSYEVALSLSLVCGVMAAGTLQMPLIVAAQQQKQIWFVFENFGLMGIAFMIYLIAATAEINRTPFDLPEAESELVAGFHTEYSGFRWALFMLAEYGNIFVVASVGVVLFWGGWLRPFPNVGWLEVPMNYGVPLLLFGGSALSSILLVKRLKERIQQIVLMIVIGGLGFVGLLFLWPAFNQASSAVFWFLFKVSLWVYLMVWFRGTFPRFRYDQLMNVGWKVLIPGGMFCVLANAVVGMWKQ